MWQERVAEFVTLLVVVNPFGVLPAFLAITSGPSAAAQRRIAIIAVVVSFLVLALFMVIGGFLLHKMGISLRAFQIGGGIILFLVALEMVRGESHETDAAGRKRSVAELAIYPIAIPKIAGPASMLAAVVLTDDHRFDVVQLSMTMGVLVVVMAITLAMLLAAGPISRVIGESGASVIGRVLGMILVALAVNTILNAFGDWLHLPPL